MLQKEILELSFNNRKVEVAVYTDGTASTKDILLLHGLGSNTVDSFGNLSKSKTLGNRICGFDWIGHGYSSRPTGLEDTYDAEYCSSFMLVVIKELIRKKILNNKFSIIAKSMSAIPTSYLYPTLEDKLEKLVFVTPAGLDKKMGYIFAFFSNCITRSIIFSWFFSFFVPKKKPRKVLQNNLRTKYWGLIVSKYARAGYNIWGHMRNTHYIPHKFKKIKKPVLLLCDRKDKIFPDMEYLNFAIANKWEFKKGDIRHDFDNVFPDPSISALILFLCDL